MSETSSSSLPSPLPFLGFVAFPLSPSRQKTGAPPMLKIFNMDGLSSEKKILDFAHKGLIDPSLDMSSNKQVGMAMKRVTHLIFDMDGLLLDTERIYTEATNIILKPFGLVFPMNVKIKMMGLRSHDAGELFIREMNLHGKLTANEYLEQREKLHSEMWCTSRLMPGVEKLLTYAFESGIAAAVATSPRQRRAITRSCSKNSKL